MSKVLVNSSGQVLKTNDGSKILKQNYNFGKAFNMEDGNSNIGSYNISAFKIDFDAIVNLNLDTFSYVAFVKGINNRGYFKLAAYTDEITTYTDIINGNSNGYNLNIIGSSSNIGETFTYQAYNSSSTISNGYQKKSSLNGVLSTTSSTSPILSTDDYNKLSLIRMDDSTLYDYKISYLLFYNRELTDVEISYLYNNFLSNEPLKTSGLIGLYKFNSIEEINEGELNIRDYSGNGNHAIVSEFVDGSIPSGTIEEQLEYLNEYCIVW